MYDSVCMDTMVAGCGAVVSLGPGWRVRAASPAWFLKNVARNSPASISDFEIVSLGLQRLWGVSKNDQVKLRATLGEGGWGVGSICSGPSVSSARALRSLPLGLRVVAASPAWFLKNVARNSPASISDFEIVSLGLQRLWGVSKNDQVKLRATFLGGAAGREVGAQLGAGLGCGAQLGARLGRGGLRASSAARCSRLFQYRRSTGACAR